MEESKPCDVVEFSDDVVAPRNPEFEVKWHNDDPENPRNWSVWYRSFIVAAMSFSTTTVYVKLSIHHVLEIPNHSGSKIQEM